MTRHELAVRLPAKASQDELTVDRLIDYVSVADEVVGFHLQQAALISMLTALPAVLLIFGRRIFWPAIPRAGDQHETGLGLLGRLARWIEPRSRSVAIVTAVVLAIMALGLVKTNTGLNSLNGFRSTPDSVLIILAILLRAIVAPLVLVATVILSFAAALGVSVVAFDRLFGFAGIDPSLPLLAFVFLVALGIDYNIFLMARVREESERIGTHRGVLTGLTVTGGVITSAGIVLAGTFSVLGILPLVALTEIGFIVAFGVLLDTFVVRSVLVPALALTIGPRIWWPSALSRGSTQRHT